MVTFIYVRVLDRCRHLVDSLVKFSPEFSKFNHEGRGKAVIWDVSVSVDVATGFYENCAELTLGIIR